MARDLDLTETSLREWVRRAEIEEGKGPPGAAGVLFRVVAPGPRQGATAARGDTRAARLLLPAAVMRYARVVTIDQICQHVACNAAARLGGDLRGLALFGSRARGGAREDSDVDVLLIADRLPEDLLERAELLRAVRAGLAITPCVQILARTAEHFEEDVTPLHLDLALDARVLYERDGYLTRKIERLRSLIREAGLHRKPNLFWEWSTPPARPDWAITWDGVRL